MLVEAETSNMNIVLKMSFMSTSSLTCFPILCLAFWTAVLLYQTTTKLPGYSIRGNTNKPGWVIADI